jgi:Ca2+-binding RTX toxin-like protein
MVNFVNLTASFGDVVLSPDGSTIYTSSSDGYLRVFDALTGTLTHTWDVGSNLGGIDISADGAFVMVTERTPLQTNPADPWWNATTIITAYKVDTSTGQATSFPFTATGMDYTFYDVAILADNKVLFSQDFSGSGWPGLAVLDLTSGQYSDVNYSMTQNDVLVASRDDTSVFVGESNISDARVDIYQNGSVPYHHQFYADGVSGFNNGILAYSAEAGLAAQSVPGNGLHIYNASLSYLRDLSDTFPQWMSGVAGLAFDATGANLFVLDSTANAVVQVSTTSWTIVQSVAVGTDVYAQTGNSFGNDLIVSPNGQYFSVDSGHGLVLVHNPLAPPIDGTGGADRLVGTYFNDMISGLAGDDTLIGGAGDDFIYGGLGSDWLMGGSGSNSLDGYDGIDTASYRDANVGVTVDLNIAAAQNTGFSLDVLAAIESIEGSEFADRLSGDEIDNRLDGRGGSDWLSGGVGDDVIDGGDGEDTVSYWDADDGVTVNLGLATAQVTGQGSDAIVNVEAVEGSSYVDFLTGNAGSNRIDGRGSADAMTGGAGDDTYAVDNMGDVVTELSAEGTDTVETSVGSTSDFAQLFILPANVENLTGTSAGGLGVEANALDNVVLMGGGDDLIVLADGGADAVNAGGGNDYIYFGSTWTIADTVDGGSGVDTIGLIGSATISLTAQAMVNVERMAVYSALYTGGGAFDYSITLVNANIGASFFFTAASLQSNEHLTFDASAETSGAITVHGGNGDDLIKTGAAHDYIIARAGNDVIIAGGASDIIFGGAGNDTFVYTAISNSTAAASDDIRDFANGDLIDLALIDANTNSISNDAFTFVGTAVFSHTAGELRVVNTSGANWQVQADTNGDGVADLVILVGVSDGQPLGVGGFVL